VAGLYSRPPLPEVLAELVEGYLRTPTLLALAAFGGALDADHRGGWARVDRPTLILAMNNQWSARFVEQQRAIAGSRLLLLDGVGHVLFLEDPARFNELVERFLGERPR
jgi:pimeloyl-ACP methyl ester carboxylesterase